MKLFYPALSKLGIKALSEQTQDFQHSILIRTFSYYRAVF